MNEKEQYVIIHHWPVEFSAPIFDRHTVLPRVFENKGHAVEMAATLNANTKDKDNTYFIARLNPSLVVTANDDL